MMELGNESSILDIFHLSILSPDDLDARRGEVDHSREPHSPNVGTRVLNIRHILSFNLELR